jgi:hypothetical protein
MQINELTLLSSPYGDSFFRDAKALKVAFAVFIKPGRSDIGSRPWGIRFSERR